MKQTEKMVDKMFQAESMVILSDEDYTAAGSSAGC